MVKLSKSDKILLAMVSYQENNGSSKKMSVEDVAVKAWKLFEDDFSLRGYPNYPNADIQKYITKLFDESWVKGGVQNYLVTSKGLERAGRLDSKYKKSSSSRNVRREVEQEVSRIQKLKLLKEYEKNASINLRIPDFLKFLGTTSQILRAKDRNLFKTRFKLIDEDVMRFIEEEEVSKSKQIIELWDKLKSKFKEKYNEKL